MPLKAEPTREHVVRFYEDERRLAEAVVEHLTGSLKADGAAIVVATSDHQAAIAKRLAANGHDLEALRARGRLVEVDAAETLAEVLRDDWPDAERLEQVVGRVVEQALRRTPSGRLAAYGEMVALLCADGNHAAALHLERLWNQLAERYPLALLCAYPLAAFSGEGHEKALALVCAAHDRAVPTEAHTALSCDRARADYVIELQRKGLAMDREHGRRVEAEDALHRRERELTEVLENMRDGVLDIDPDGRVRGANRAYLAFLDTSAADHLGRDVRTFLSPNHVLDEVWVRLVRGNVARGEIVELTARDGRPRRASIENAVLRMVGRTLSMRWFLQLLPD